MALVAYSERTLLIKSTAQLLRMPHKATSTALTLLHRYMHAVTADDLDIALIAACLLLASKAEEAPVKTVELINALKACLAKSQGSKPSNSGCTVHPPIEVLVGEECTAIKQEMQFKEQVLLRETSFNLHVNNTQKYLLNFGKSAEMQASTVQIASFLCNDSLVYTNLCTQYEAAEIAAGCLVAASLIGRIARLHKQSLDFSNFGLPKLRVEAVAHLLFEMLEVTNPDNAS